MILERELDTCWIFFHFISNFYIIFKIKLIGLKIARKEGVASKEGLLVVKAFKKIIGGYHKLTLCLHYKYWIFIAFGMDFLIMHGSLLRLQIYF